MKVITIFFISLFIVIVLGLIFSIFDKRIEKHKFAIGLMCIFLFIACSRTLISAGCIVYNLIKENKEWEAEYNANHPPYTYEIVYCEDSNGDMIEDYLLVTTEDGKRERYDIYMDTCKLFKLVKRYDMPLDDFCMKLEDAGYIRIDNTKK